MTRTLPNPAILARGAATVGLLLLVPAWVLGWTDALGLALDTELFLGLSLALAAALAFLLPPGDAPADAPVGVPRGWQMAVALAALVALGTLALMQPHVHLRIARPDLPMLIAGTLAIAAVFAATWRRLGPVLPLVLLALAVFVVWIGPALPDRFATRPVSGARFVAYLAFDTNGLLSRLVYIAVATIAPFVFFGTLIAATGAGRSLTEPLQRLLAGSPGGPAKAAVASSALFGTISGSAVANVSTSGPITIPLMTRGGMAPHRAAAVEAVASSAGQLLPPIMGASAFLIAEFLGLPYREVALAALVPACLIFATLVLTIDFGARARGERFMPEPPARDPAGGLSPRLRLLLHAVVPMAVLVHQLFVVSVAPGKAALIASGVAMAIWLATPGNGGLRSRAAALLRASVGAVGPIAGIILLAGAAALVMGLLNLSGTGFMLTLRLVELADGSFALLAVLTAALTLVLGLGMPTVGVYVIAATLCAPALVAAGAAPLSAHLFVLAVGMLSMVTPPVALASFSAAMIAGAPLWRTAFTALAYALGLVVVAAAFLFQPVLLEPGAGLPFVVALLPCLLALALLAAAQAGHAGLPLGPVARLAAVALAAANLAVMTDGQPSPAWAAALLAGAALLALHSTAGQRLMRARRALLQETRP